MIRKRLTVHITEARAPQARENWTAPFASAERPVPAANRAQYNSEKTIEARNPHRGDAWRNFFR
jgi:hypothetical protein